MEPMIDYTIFESEEEPEDEPDLEKWRAEMEDGLAWARVPWYEKVLFGRRALE